MKHESVLGRVYEGCMGAKVPFLTHFWVFGRLRVCLVLAYSCPANIGLPIMAWDSNAKGWPKIWQESLKEATMDSLAATYLATNQTTHKEFGVTNFLVG
jgi:hypothetical protein